MILIAIKPIQVNINMKLANTFPIKLLSFLAICFHGNNFTLATVRIFKVIPHKDHAYTRKDESMSSLLRILLHIYVKDNQNVC